MSLSISSNLLTQRAQQFLQRVGRIPSLVILLWIITLWWGERSVFETSASACEWENWESWPAGAVPHHVLFIADPQLVDPHTYPGRPWPLSTLTVLYTDLYMRRTYRYLLNHVQPHTTMFLGDLFDGGREWAALEYQSPEDRYKKYGNTFWLKEYDRFMKMFIGGWYDHNWDGPLAGEGRKIIASLPGNHDLGFAGGINDHVRDRFEAHFGPSNRIDILGNHTFVSLDTVSLSAMDQVDPVTGSSGAGDGTGQDTKHMDIWKPVEQFLLDAGNRRNKAVQRRYQHLKSISDPNLADPDKKLKLSRINPSRIAGDILHEKHQKDSQIPSSNFPTILLSHVPLYRNSDVTCGPLRERGNAIPLSAGYQYQNVLTPVVSDDIINHLDADQVTMIYSGDDHDYCEVEHGQYTGRIKEITVKSMSWAMGVRKPGVQLASLYNPIDLDSLSQGNSPTQTPRDTIQNHLCLLPDQLSIFIRYGQLLGLSLLLLLIRIMIYHPPQHLPPVPPSQEKSQQPLLPLTHKPESTPTQSTTSTPLHNARARSSGKIPRSSSPFKPDHTPIETDERGSPKPNRAAMSSRRTTVASIARGLATPADTRLAEFGRSLVIVAVPVLGFYAWLLSNG